MLTTEPLPSKLAFEYDRKDLSDESLLSLYKAMLFPRLVEEKMLVLLRQGKISKWFSGIGQEAISVGITKALQSQDYIFPLHRNLGVFTSRDVSLKRLIAQWLGKPSGFTNGRDRSFHFGLPEKRIIGMISHLGAMLPVANGVALAAQNRQEDFVAAVFSGDGGTSEGDFHEALNVASVWNLPVLFVVENNGYGLSTPTSEQYNCKRIADRAVAYGIPGYTLDGNNILEVYHTVSDILSSIRQTNQPVLLECATFRMRGHEEASGTKYVPEELFQMWEQKDPIRNYESFLMQEGVISESLKKDIEAQYKDEISLAVAAAFHAQEVMPDREREAKAIYQPFQPEVKVPNLLVSEEKRFVDALSEGLRESMYHHPELVIMGQDIADYGGVFKITEGMLEEFGESRIKNTPICESAIVGMGLGLSLEGIPSVVEMQFADFVSCAFNQIVNNLAKNHYRWGHAPNVVVRMPAGGGVGAGPFHSQTNESWFTQVPGLKVVYPARPEDAKGLLCAAIQDPNPIIFFEHKGLYRSIKGQVPEGYYHTSLGEAHHTLKGEEVSIITYGMGVHWALQLAEKVEPGVIDIIDLRTLIPWDKEKVYESVKRCGKVIVLYEATQTSAFGAEIAASIMEECFEFLDAPVKRIGSLDTPVPFHPSLEKQFLANSSLEKSLADLMAY
ncbi:MAG: thiamine pyrophosphate-dependent enzyme [Bacteroidota bacterium]